MNGAYDRRGSSISADVDAAIERLVEHFESSDLALRLDVLRALSAQAKLAFETTRVREHLAKHPVSMDLIQGVTSLSTVYKTLAEKMTVDSCSCDYDVQRNVVMTTNVRWTLEPQSCKKPTKKRKKVMASVSKEEKGPLITTYKFERVRQEAEEEGEQETLIRFTVVVAVGDNDANPRELLHFEMACEYAYPKSYYEEQKQLPSGRPDFGEDLRGFRFNNEVLAAIGDWMGADDEELDPVDVIGFFLALPVHEDEWLVDERVCEILFQGGMEADSDGYEEEDDED
ncbi:hypothetical protein GN244_ATG19534 [Phytophthora infestans]|uniref:Nucleosome assembly protein n=1 Tax=Phytophthora infestans TaxID=4787 RepID=A0A833SPU1_PHYIN|nr:hypothetical protein GN244_ATG19534 [Phytophthora infestans]